MGVQIARQHIEDAILKYTRELTQKATKNIPKIPVNRIV